MGKATISNSELTKLAELLDASKAMEKEIKSLRNKVLAVHDATGDEVIRRGNATALIEISERRYPKWKDLLESLKGKPYVDSVIENTEPIIVRGIKVKVAA